MYGKFLMALMFGALVSGFYGSLLFWLLTNVTVP